MIIPLDIVVHQFDSPNKDLIQGHRRPSSVCLTVSGKQLKVNPKGHVINSGDLPAERPLVPHAKQFPKHGLV